MLQKISPQVRLWRLPFDSTGLGPNAEDSLASLTTPNVMTATLLIASGLLFLVEGCAGIFMPAIYALTEPGEQGRFSKKLKLAGLLLGLFGVVFVLASLPPQRVAHGFLLLFGAGCITKSSLMILAPQKLRDRPEYIRNHLAAWRIRSAVRAGIGVIVIGWGIGVWLLAA